jgi:hypothetical protein
MFAYPHRTTRLLQDGLSRKIFEYFFKNLSKNQVSLKSAKNNWYFTLRSVYIFFVIYSLILLRVRNISYNSCRENQNTYIVFKNLLSKVMSFFEIIRKNIVKPRRPQISIWRMPIPCWKTKTTHTHTHTEYVMLIGLPLHKLLKDRTAILC